MSDTLQLIFTAIGCTAAAAWVLRSGFAKLDNRLANLEGAFEKHVTEDKEIHAKVIAFEKKRPRR
jgi:hypothetical protein